MSHADTLRAGPAQAGVLMAGMGPAPKPGAINRNKPAYDWVHLPAEGRGRPAPPVPSVRHWSDYTVRLWEQLWASPMAAQWREDDPALIRYLVLTEELMTTDGAIAPIAAQLTTLDDRLGLTPKARNQLRWLLPGDLEPAPVTQLRPVESPGAKRRAALRKKIDGKA